MDKVEQLSGTKEESKSKKMGRPPKKQGSVVQKQNSVEKTGENNGSGAV